MTTKYFNLPLITDNMANDVVRDMNALAEATDDALKGLGDSKANTADLTHLQTQVTQHLDEVMTQFIAVNRDLSLVGAQVVTGFIEVPKFIEIRAFVHGTPKHSVGGVYSNSQAALYVANDGKAGGWGGAAILLAENTSGTHVRGEVLINNDKTITINWIRGGAGSEGTAAAQIIAHYHGGDA